MRASRSSRETICERQKLIKPHADQETVSSLYLIMHDDMKRPPRVRALFVFDFADALRFGMPAIVSAPFSFLVSSVTARILRRQECACRLNRSMQHRR